MHQRPSLLPRTAPAPTSLLPPMDQHKPVTPTSSLQLFVRQFPMQGCWSPSVSKPPAAPTFATTSYSPSQLLPTLNSPAGSHGVSQNFGYKIHESNAREVGKLSWKIGEQSKGFRLVKLSKKRTKLVLGCGREGLSVRERNRKRVSLCLGGEAKGVGCPSCGGKGF